MILLFWPYFWHSGSDLGGEENKIDVLNQYNLTMCLASPQQVSLNCWASYDIVILPLWIYSIL